MNKRILIFSVLIISLFIVFRFCNTKPEKVVEEKPLPLNISQNSATFNESFSILLHSYLSLKDAFVSTDTVKANSVAMQLMQNADSLNVNEIKGDSSGTIRETAKYYAATISGSAKTVATENKIEDKLRDFDMITDALWTLTRTVQYEGQKLYYQFCPQALDNKGAYWLSDKIDGGNPYFIATGTCSEVADSLDYSKR